MWPQNRRPFFTAAIIYLAGISMVGLLASREQTVLVGMAYFSAFFAYFWSCWFPPVKSAAFGLGLVARIILFFGMPTLSDDIYRFLWDGYLLLAGISPFAELPIYYASEQTALSGLTPDLYGKLNSPEYFTIYPPINQALFWLSVQTGHHWLLSAGILRIVLLASDIGSFFLIRRLLSLKGLSPDLANWYWLNPLVVLEIVGNIHFEGLVLFFLLLSVYFYYHNQVLKSGAALGLAVGTKLLPLIFLPAFFFTKSIKKGLLICTSAVVIAAISIIPMVDSVFIAGMSSSINLYFQKFEFNASIYFVLRAIGYWIKGYNIIETLGPILSIITAVSIVGLSVLAYWKNWALERTLLFILTIYLSMATIIHPWYIIPLIALGLLSRFWYPIIWSLLIFVTYLGYTSNGYSLSLYWIALEYVAVFVVLVYELLHEKNTQHI